MPDLFGIDIAGILNTEIANAGGLPQGTLTKVTRGTRTSGSLTAGLSETPTTHTFNGFLEQGQVRIPGTRATETGDFITILGASVTPTAVPGVNDTVVLEGQTYELVELMVRDPAAATYMFRVKRA